MVHKTVKSKSYKKLEGCVVMNSSSNLRTNANNKKRLPHFPLHWWY